MNTHLVFSKIQATKHCWPKKSLRSIDSWPDRRSSWSQGNQLVNSVEMNCFFLVCCDPTPDSWRWIWLQRVQFWTSLRGPLQTGGNGKLLEFFCWETNRFCWERSFEIVGCKTNASNGDVLKCYFARLQILVCSANSEFSSTVDIYIVTRGKTLRFFKITEIRVFSQNWERVWMTLRKHDILNSVDILILNIISCHKQPATSWAPCLFYYFSLSWTGHSTKQCSSETRIFRTHHHAILAFWCTTNFRVTEEAGGEG